MIKINDIEVTQFTFPGGEVQVRFTGEFSTTCNLIVAKLHSSDDVMALLMVKSIIDRKAPEATCLLEMDYLPYARQDRVCQEGEAEACKIMIQLINSMSFDAVHIMDIHSTKMLRFLGKCLHTPQHMIVRNVVDLDEYDFVVAPDAGALPKIQKLNFPNVITATKVRDVKTGEITHTEVNVDLPLIKGKKLLIVDDICDGGRTFIELAKVLRQGEPKLIDLYVTHGIFSKGTDIFDNLINTIHCPNPFKELT